MDTRSLDCFLAVAEELNFRRAAERVHLTQPSLSQRIRQLEEEIGTELFERDRRHVALAPAGLAFLEPARNAIASLKAAKQQALRAARGEAGQLRLGFTVIAFYGALPEAVRAFRNRFPEVSVELVEMNSPLLEAALASGDIDLGVVHPPLTTPGLKTHKLPDQTLVLALPTAHPLAGKPVVRLRDLDGEPMLMAPRAIGPSFHDRIIALFQAEGISPNIVQEVSPMTTLTGLVAAGTGMGFVTAGVATVSRPGVTFRPVRPKPAPLPMAAAWRGPEITSTGARFLDVVSEINRA